MPTQLFTLPPEWAPHKAIWTAFPAHRDWASFQDEARDEVITMVRLLSAGDNVKVLAKPGEAYQIAHQAMQDFAEVIEAPYGDIWLRDTGPIYGFDDMGKPFAHRFRFNGWGGKFVYEGDEAVGGIIASRTATKTTRHDFILEGGSIDLDGTGLCLTTKQCLLNTNRNPGWTKEIAEQKLIEALGLKKILWLDEGLQGDHTDGHIDNIARFVAPGKVVCQTASGDSDPNIKTLKRIEDTLRAMTMLDGTPLEVVTVPSPGLVMIDDAVQAASHMNFIIGNKTVVVPGYNGLAVDACKALAPLFPGREVVHASASAIITGGGSFHCITQQQPA
jgi:agmatine deiminase